MFASEYQGGASVLVLSGQERQSAPNAYPIVSSSAAALVAVNGSNTGSNTASISGGSSGHHTSNVVPSFIKKEYDKSIRGFSYAISGAAAANRFTLPSANSSKQSLTLTQPFLVIQCLFDAQRAFTIELNVRDKLSQRHRLFLSSNFHNVLLHPLHAQLPADFVKRGVWLNLTFDLPLLLTQTTKQTFHSVESMTINPTCRIRKVFTVRQCPVDTTDDSEVLGWTNPHEQQTDAIPKAHDFPPTVAHQTQLVSVDKMTAYERVAHKRTKTTASAHALSVTSRPSASFSADRSGTAPIIRSAAAPSLLDDINFTNATGSPTNRRTRDGHDVFAAAGVRSRRGPTPADSMSAMNGSTIPRSPTDLLQKQETPSRRLLSAISPVNAQTVAQIGDDSAAIVAPSITRHRRTVHAVDSHSTTPTAAEQSQMIGAAVSALAIVGSNRLHQRAPNRQTLSGRTESRQPNSTRTATMNAANSQRQSVSETTTPFTSRPSSPPTQPYSLPTSPSTLPSLKHSHNTVPPIQARTHRRNISKSESQPQSQSQSLAPLNEEFDAESRIEKRAAQHNTRTRRTHETDAAASDDGNTSAQTLPRRFIATSPFRVSAQQVRHATAPNERHNADHSLYADEDDDDDEFVRRLDITSDHRPLHRIPPIQLSAAVRVLQSDAAVAALPPQPPVTPAQGAESYRSVESPKLSDYSASPSPTPSVSSSRSYSYSSADDLDKDESSVEERIQERLQQSKLNTTKQHFSNDDFSERQHRHQQSLEYRQQHRTDVELNESTRAPYEKSETPARTESSAPSVYSYSLSRSLSKSQSHAKLQSRSSSRPHSSVSSFSNTPVHGTPITSEQIIIPTDIPPLKQTLSNNANRPPFRLQQLNMKASNDGKDDDAHEKHVSSVPVSTPRSPRHDLSAGYMYDPILKCYFDPTTNKYFEVIV